MLSSYIDLRSDTVTNPCKEMRNAIYMAEVGDEFYENDPTTKRLEEYCAELFGTEDAVFMISGTMANQVSVRCHTVAGDEFITEGNYHILCYESSATSDLGKVTPNYLYSKDGILRKEDVKFLLNSRARNKFTAPPKLVWVENTVNHFAGKAYSYDDLSSLYNFSKDNNMSLHIDGARLFNASVAKGIKLDKFALCSDSIMISFSKGLGAPAGAVLLGSKELIMKAKLYKKWYGGGMHQSGVIASAAMYAILNNIKFIEEDHENAKILATILSNEDKIQIEIKSVESNIVMFSLEKLHIYASDFIKICKEYGILLYPWNLYVIRAVTHKDISKKDILKTAETIIKIIRNWK